MKRKYWIPAFLLVLTVSGYAQMSKALDAYNQGLEFQDRGDNVNALRLYNKAIELDARMVDAYNNRANLKLAAGDQAGAIADFSKAIEISPAQALSFYNRGNIYLEKNEYDAAIRDFSSAIKLLDGLTNNYDKRAHGMSFNNRGNALMAKGDAKSALSDYARALQIMPNSFEAFTGSGSAKFHLGDAAGAVADYTSALKIFPKNTLILMNRAGALETIDPNAAIQDYSIVIELEPDNAGAYARRGLTKLGKGQKQQAAEDLTRAFSMEPALKNEYDAFLKEALKK